MGNVGKWIKDQTIVGDFIPEPVIVQPPPAPKPQPKPEPKPEDDDKTTIDDVNKRVGDIDKKIDDIDDTIANLPKPETAAEREARINAISERNELSQLWIARVKAEKTAKDFVDQYVRSETSRARVRGTSVEFKPEQIQALYSSRFADVFSAENESRLGSLEAKYGSAGKRTYSRGEGGKFKGVDVAVKSKSYPGLRPLSNRTKNTVLTDDEIVNILGSPTLLGA